jgi:hypothetical protein
VSLFTSIGTLFFFFFFSFSAVCILSV